MKQKFILTILLILVSIALNSCLELEKNNSFETQNSLDYSLISSNINFNNNNISENNDEKAEQIYELGKSFFEAKEYEKAKNIFLPIIEDDTTKLFNEDHYYSSDLGGFKTQRE